MRILLTGGAGFIGSALVYRLLSHSDLPAKLRRARGWAPQEDFASALRKTVHGCLANRDWRSARLAERARLHRQSSYGRYLARLLEEPA
ncbi:MAG TPA: NAD-dependent epimerase/dehydratase family protein [Pseudomonas sp.]|nr:NAD-dependent epimerase/dehydratase family protein [Pseudomonas sp.]